MDARSVRARMAPSSRDGGAGLPFRPTRQRTGDLEPCSDDATAFFARGLSAAARYFRLCGAQRPRNVNFSNLGKLLVAEAAGVQRRQCPGNTMIVCAVWRVWVPRMSGCSSRTVHLALGLGCELWLAYNAIVTMEVGEESIRQR